MTRGDQVGLHCLGCAGGAGAAFAVGQSPVPGGPQACEAMRGRWSRRR